MKFYNIHEVCIQSQAMTEIWPFIFHIYLFWSLSSIDSHRMTFISVLIANNHLTNHSQLITKFFFYPSQMSCFSKTHRNRGMVGKNYPIRQSTNPITSSMPWLDYLPSHQVEYRRHNQCKRRACSRGNGSLMITAQIFTRNHCVKRSSSAASLPSFSIFTRFSAPCTNALLHWNPVSPPPRAL